MSSKGGKGGRRIHISGERITNFTAPGGFIKVFGVRGGERGGKVTNLEFGKEGKGIGQREQDVVA